ncbi:putative 2OG-Fe(II) oxygenase [Thalassotalea ponticola]|uniref:2OG-Fe(II) oxygenase family protein n=1 Tax=Thalassotalea ponticola TaxID=1523392 RepID=UPI0025B60A15|nr:putative 2OG-Fe(II) oxygenase [Thalassotalea ponticola]MDN3651509.1 putative 2OG-Fe(II) oxygenase [Thalassotalea ponticola]
MKNTLNSLANNAMLSLRQGDLVNALGHFEQLQKHNIGHFELIKAHGIALLKHGQLARAKQRLLDALHVNPNADELHNVVGDLLRKEGQLQQAKQHLQQAIKLNMSVYQYYFNLGLCYKQSKQWTEAIKQFEKVLQLTNSHDKSALALADCFSQMRQLDKAVHYLSTVTDKSALSYLLQWCELEIKRKDPSSAQIWFDRAKHNHKTNPHIYQTFGLALLHQGYSNRALQVFNAGLDMIADDSKLLDLATSLAYEMAQDRSFSLYQKIPASKLTPKLMAAHINKLLNSDQTEQAQIQLEQYTREYGESLELIYGQCQIYKKHGQFEQLLEHVDNQQIDLSNVAHSHIKELVSESLLATNDVVAANKHIDQLLSWQASNQYYWALKSSCLRLIDDDAYQQLCDYDQVVFQRELQIDQTKYANIDVFNSALLEALSACHNMNQQPLAQSVYQGTQTPGFLFDQDIEVVQDLKRYLLITAQNTLTENWINKLSPTHPVRQFYRADFDFATAWSIWIKQGGFHRSHVHPKGWYSSAYYAAVPTSVTQSTDKQGYFAIGQPGLNLSGDMANTLTTERYVKPQAGVLNLFPSYVWHSTLPFSGSQPRISVAFDLK